MQKYNFLFALIALLSVWGCTEKEPIPEPVVPDAPKNVRLTDASATTLSFAWDAVEGAVKYGVRLEDADGKLVGSVSYPTSNQVKYKELSVNSEYAFKVKVFLNDAESSYSTPLNVRTLAEDEDDGGDGDDDQDDPVVTPNEYYDRFMIPSAEDSHGKTLAFPGAEGGGMYTTGGRGGKVIHVTTLADSGAGSLRAALAESGSRTIVFDVAGIIELNSTLKINKGDVTIAGQTAPGDGICLKNFSTQITSSNVIIRFVRFRMGDEKKNEGDAIWGRYFENIIIDHCSMSWSTDECASFYANRNFTLQWCILSESLRNSVHGKGKHGYGGIWGGKDASFHHNLLAHHDSRNPRIDHPQVYGDYVSTHRGNVDYRCNAVYNWGSNHTYGGEDGWFNVVNNHYKPGPASKDRKYFVDAYGSYVKDGTVYADSYPELYLSGNVNTDHPDLSAANDATSVYWHNGSSYGNYNMTLSSPLSIVGPSGEDVYTTVHSAEDSFERILECGGASLVRDDVDLRACSDARSGTAAFTDGGNGSKNGIIDTQTAVGGWPAYEATSDQLARMKDTDGDGMPDWFEKEFGLDASDPSDGNMKTLDSYSRYTNLEMYLHYLVRDIVSKQNAGGTYKKIS